MMLLIAIKLFYGFGKRRNYNLPCRNNNETSSKSGVYFMKSRKTKLLSIIVLTLVLVLISCYSVVEFLAAEKETSTTFIGEDTNWAVTVKVNKNGKLVEGTYVAKYKGDDIESLLEKEIKYRVNYKSTSSGGSAYLSDSGILEGNAFRKSCDIFCSYSRIDDSELTFVVVVDGNEKSISLQKNE